MAPTNDHDQQMMALESKLQASFKYLSAGGALIPAAVAREWLRTRANLSIKTAVSHYTESDIDTVVENCITDLQADMYIA